MSCGDRSPAFRDGAVYLPNLCQSTSCKSNARPTKGLAFGDPHRGYHLMFWWLCGPCLSFASMMAQAATPPGRRKRPWFSVVDVPIPCRVETL